MGELSTVLVVEDHLASRSTLRALLEDSFLVLEARDGKEGVAATKAHRPDVVLMDLHLPNKSGIDAIREIARSWPDVKVVAMTAAASVEECIEALSAGACGIVLKSGGAGLVLEAVHGALEGRTVVDPSVAPALLRNYRDLKTRDSVASRRLETERRASATLRRLVRAGQVRAFVQALEVRCSDTAGHSDRLAETSRLIAAHLGVDPAKIGDIEIGAHLHDIGKVGIPDSILWKPGPLDEAEWSSMRAHPLIGGQMVGSAGLPRRVGLIVRHHHERYDGGGYPDGLRAGAIPLGARIVAVADAYDSMRSARPYRAPMARDEALRRLREGRGGHFDPDVVDAFPTLAVPEPPSSDEAPAWRQFVGGSGRGG